MTVVPEIAEFLRLHPPFSELDPSVVESVASAVEVEFHAAGAIIFSQGAQPVEFLRVIRAGVVEVVSDGRVLDDMGPGEMFGHASMLSGLPPGFEARAAEDSLTYRIPSEAAAEALAGPRALRYVTRLLLEDRHRLRSGPRPDVLRDLLRQPVRAAIRGEPLICEPSLSIREAARRMTEVGATALVVGLDESVGIVTDSDLRSRVVARGLTTESPIADVMTAPAFTVSGETSGSDVLLDMLDRGVRHFPVTSPTGGIIGVVEDHDLVEVESRSSFFLRRAVMRATTVEELVAASAGLRPAVIGMSRGGMAALDVLSVFSVVTDALTRRALDFAVAEAGESLARFSWLALGSQARREALPSSDLDSAIAWLDGRDEKGIRAYLVGVATKATETLVRCGFAPDEHRVNAADPLFVRSLSEWRSESVSFLDNPDQHKALVIVSVLVDSRPVWGVETQPLITETFRMAPRRPRLLRLLAEFALSHRPPAGFSRGLVVDSSGDHRRVLDLKVAAVTPITDLARWAGMAAGVACASTTTRLQVARDSGTLHESDAANLQEAFELVSQLRLDHQVAQLEEGVPVDDLVDASELSPLVRSYLKESFHAVASVQKRVAAEISWMR
jgi:CBS domain-containing protein